MRSIPAPKSIPAPRVDSCTLRRRLTSKLPFWPSLMDGTWNMELEESARGSFRIGVRMTITGPNELSGPNDHVLLECMCIFSQFSEFRISAFRKCPSFQYVYFQSDLIF